MWETLNIHGLHTLSSLHPHIGQAKDDGTWANWNNAFWCKPFHAINPRIHNMFDFPDLKQAQTFHLASIGFFQSHIHQAWYIWQ